MSKSKILIVEDEAIVAKDISICLKRLGYEVVGSFPKGEKALEFLKTNTPDLILCDIMLAGKISGIDTAAEVKKLYQIPIIFLTAYADESTINKAKVTEPYGYILKPFKEVDIRTSIEMALYKHEKNKEHSESNRIDETQKKNKDYIFVKSNSRLIKIENKNLLFVEALKDYVVVHTPSERYTIHSTMKDIDKKLLDEVFIRVHRSYIVNIKKIKAIDGQIITLLETDKRIPIGGSYKEALFEVLQLG